VAAKKMREIIIDYFRHKDAAREPPEGLRVELEDFVAGIEDKRDEALIVDEALNRLAEFDSRAAQVVELRYFGGQTLEEIAELLGYDVRTIKRDWEDARAWLRQFLLRRPPPEN
jgi:RNA polymerase sigma factor (TIGR02999 family)